MQPHLSNVTTRANEIEDLGSLTFDIKHSLERKQMLVIPSKKILLTIEHLRKYKVSFLLKTTDHGDLMGRMTFISL